MPPTNHAPSKDPTKEEKLEALKTRLEQVVDSYAMDTGTAKLQATVVAIEQLNIRRMKLGEPDEKAKGADA